MVLSDCWGTNSTSNTDRIHFLFLFVSVKVLLSYNHVMEGGYVGDLLEEAAGPHSCVGHQVIHCRNEGGISAILVSLNHVKIVLSVNFE